MLDSTPTFDQKFLAIDFGTKRIGLAVSRGPIAVPFKVISYQDLAIAIEEIAAICKTEKIESVILGVSEKDTARKTKNFGALLRKTLSVPVIYADETLTSKEVKEKFKQRKKQLPKEIDHFSAALILEQWLETKGS